MTDAARRQIRAATLIWMASVMLSRVAGLLREMVIARTAGATGDTDVYFSAFTLPDFLNYLLAGGALSITFIPIFTMYLLKGEDEEGWRVFSSVMTFVGLALTTVLVLAWIFAEPLCAVLVSGFSAEQQTLLVRYTRILLPAQLFFFAGGLFGAAQMARGRHGIYAFSPLVYNSGIILVGLLLAPYMGLEGFCWGALIGAALGHGVLQAWGAGRAGMMFAPRLDFRHVSVRQYFILTFPFMIGQSILATDDWLIRHYGSHLAAASISWLNYAKKLAMVLPSMLGQAAAAASYPTLSRQAESGNIREMAEVLSESLARALLLAGFGGAVFIVLNREVTFLAFGSGRFSVADTLTTGKALAIMAASVPAWVAQAILARGYYALRSTWKPTLIGSAVTLLGIPVYKYLAIFMEERGEGYLGLAAASAISISLYSTALYAGLTRALRKRDPGSPPLLKASFVVRSLALVLVSLVVMAMVRGAAGGFWPGTTFIAAIVRSIVTGVAGVIVFLWLGSLLKLEREMVLPGLVRRIVRGRGTPPPP